MSRKKKAPERAEGSFCVLPHRILDSRAYLGLNFAAKALLMDLVRQLNGYNNGHLQLTTTWLRPRGWSSSDTINKSTKELIDSFLVIKTRQGGLNIGPSQFAVTWLPISNFHGLEINERDYDRGKWTQKEPLPPTKPKKPLVQNTDQATPTSGYAEAPTNPLIGSETGSSNEFTAPHTGNNVYIPSTARTGH